MLNGGGTFKNQDFRKNEITYLELYAGWNFDMTKVTTSRFRAKAASLYLNYNAKSQLSRFGMDVTVRSGPFCKA